MYIASLSSRRDHSVLYHVLSRSLPLPLCSLVVISWSPVTVCLCVVFFSSLLLVAPHPIISSSLRLFIPSSPPPLIPSSPPPLISSSPHLLISSSPRLLVSSSSHLFILSSPHLLSFLTALGCSSSRFFRGNLICEQIKERLKVC